MSSLFFRSLILLCCLCGQLATAQINANFDVDPINGCTPFVVDLIDRSVSPDSVISWNWLITGPNGFSQTSTSQNASFLLTTPGLYDVSLQACDDAGSCNQQNNTGAVEVFDHPIIDYQFSQTAGCSPFEVCFTNQIDPVCGTIASCVVDVGDGTVYNTCDFCHTYQSGGTYSIVIVTQNSCGCTSDTVIQNAIQVEPRPTAGFFSDTATTCDNSLTVNFTNTSTGIQPLQFEWFVDGNTFNSTDLSYTFGPGNYEVMLVVTDQTGCTDTMRRTDFVSVGTPIADFTLSTNTICPGETVVLTDNSPGSPNSWTWAVVGIDTISGSPIAQVTPTTPGTYSIGLEVTYPGGCSATVFKQDELIVDSGPVADFSIPDTGSCDNPFLASFTNQSQNGSVYEWSFPGGVPSTFTGFNPPNITYNSFGDFDVSLVVTGNGSCIDSLRIDKAITLRKARARYIADVIQGCAPLTVNFIDNSLTIDPVQSYGWDFDGDSIADFTSANPSVTFPDTGCITFNYEVTTVSGCVDFATFTDEICAGGISTGSFTLTPDTTCFETERVCFSFTGTGADSLVWVYDDGNIVYQGDSVGLRTMCHFYQDTGFFSPCVQTFDNGCPGDTFCAPDAVFVLLPKADFGDSSSCDNPLRIFFSDSSAGADSLIWEFGDPSTTSDVSTDRNPEWTYPAAGRYEIRLTALNFFTGCIHVLRDTIDVITPDASFEGDSLVGCAPFAVNFSNTSASVGVGSFASRWDWDGSVGGVTFSLGGANNGLSVQHIFQDPGSYSIAMRNQDVNGCWDTLVIDDYITVHGVDGGFTSDVNSGCGPLTVNFTDTSSAPFTYVDSWLWLFGDGDSSTLQNPTHIYDTNGVFDVTLIVTDSFGCRETVLRQDYISVNRPVSIFAMSDTFICGSQSVSFTDQSTGLNLTYDWSFPGGNPSTSNQPNPVVFYGIEDSFDAILTVSDPLGCADTFLRQIQVFNPVADFSTSNTQAACPPLTVSFTDQSLNNVCSWKWFFGDGDSSTLQNPSHIYTRSGRPIVTLIVTSCSGCSDTMSNNTIQIDGPDIQADVSATEACPCSDIDFVIQSVNAGSGSILPGCGRPAVNFTPATFGTFANPSIDTISIPYCDTCLYFPQVVADDGQGCQLIFNAPDSIVVDTVIVDFGLTTFSVCDSGTICFSDSSTTTVAGTFITSRVWNFGDGTTDTSLAPCHFYANPGVYQVSLTVTNNIGCVSTRTESIVLPGSPTADFDLSDSVSCAPDSIYFTDLSTPDVLAPITQWNWDFGDATTLSDTVGDAVHYYTAAGMLTVTLTIMDDQGCSDTVSRQLELRASPTINMSAPDTICLGDSVRISASGGTRYAWSPAATLSDSTIRDPFASPESATTYYVTVTDPIGCASNDSVTLRVNQIITRIVANFGGQCAGDTVFFIDSTDQIGSQIVGWNWDFGDPTSGTLNASNDQSPHHVYQDSGTYLINLTVTDANACRGDTSISISLQPIPTALFGVTAVCFGSTTTILDSSIGNGSPITTYNWQFGDGDSSALVNPTHSYNAPGAYSINLEVTNAFGCSDDTNLTASVYAIPVAIFRTDSACEDSTILYNDLSIVADWPIDTWSWQFSNGLNASQQNPTNFYDSAGDYTITLSITDEFGCSDDTTLNQFINGLPQTLLDASDTAICPGESVVLNVSGAENFEWIPDLWLSSNTGASVSASPERDVRYVVIGSNRFCGSDRDSVRVEVLSPSSIDISASPETILIGGTSALSIDITGDFDSLVWVPTDGLDCPGCLRPLASPTETTTYTAVLYFGDGSLVCQSLDTVTIFVLTECNEEVIYLPNAFTPNKDGINDYFRIRGSGLEEVELLSIFDRWGKLIFEQSNADLSSLNSGWNGLDKNGKRVMAGTYVYQIDARCVDGSTIKKHGTVNLIR